MIIIGAGMAGLLAAGMLRNEATCVIESQPVLPNNHSALLRFRSSVVGDTLNIPFKKVKVMKSVDGTMNPVASALAYSLKTNGTATLRSSVSAGGEIEERYIAPEDLVAQMAARVTCEMKFGEGWSGEGKEPTISTMPMPLLMKMLSWPDIPEFMSVSGYNITARLSNVDAYATVYVPDRLREENRISVTGNKLTIEVALPRLTHQQVADRVKATEDDPMAMETIIDLALRTLGLWGHRVQAQHVQITQQRYAKILPIDESIRRNFIMWASTTHNVYSLGRFATWRPGLLLDDVVQDVGVIQKLVRGHAGYDHRKKGL